MCGICGFSGKENKGILNEMLGSIFHRGPDDQGIYSDNLINLGISRLSIIDIQGGHQPQKNENGSIVVVFNGEIYNYIELREELKKKGHAFKTLSDTETIVHGYEEFGLDLLKRLNGMFSIAIWDTNKKELVLIRDRFGVKPLFYSFKSGVLVFGSEIKSLLYHPEVSNELDYEALSHYFSLRNIPAPFTAYKDVRALLPGQMLIFKNAQYKMVKWYKILMNIKWGEEDEGILVDKIDELLQDSVKLRLRADVDYGAYLSGGIDSSTIVAIMSKYSPKKVKTFSLVYADAPGHKIDGYYAKQVANIYSTEHHEYVMAYTELSRDLPLVIRQFDQPFAGVISSYWLSNFMRKYVKVALSGDGADDFFASYGHHRLVAPIQEAKAAKQSNRAIKEENLGFFKNNPELVLKLSSYQPWEWRLSYAAFMEHEKEALFTKQGKDVFVKYSTANFLRNIYEECDPEVDDLNKMLYLDINTLLPNEILYYNDILSMANSLEVRTPFLDFRIAELACSIPGNLKIKGLSLKYILRKVASRYVTKEILERPKEGFVLPKNTWLRKGLRQLLEEVLSAERISIHGYFNLKYVDSLVNRFLSGDDSLTFKIWTLIVFQIWYEQYLESNS